MAQAAPVLLERLVDLGIVVAVEGREVDDGLVQVAVDVDAGERHEIEAFVLDVLELGRGRRAG